MTFIYTQCLKRPGATRFILAAGILALHVACAAAQQVPVDAAAKAASTGVGGRYPAGSIKSVEVADTALAEIVKERSEIEARFTADERACHPKFFVTSCVDHAKERRRQALWELRKVEIEANAFKRQERAQERDRAAADRLEKEQADRQERAQVHNEKADAQGPVQEPASEAQRNVQTTIFSDRSAQHEAKLKQQQEEDKANEAKRAENVAAYEKKVQESQERQRKVAQRKAEKEAKQRAKQASQAGAQ